MIQTFNLTKKFRDLTAVNQLNLTINKGDIFGFIGPNGAGKTTTIKMLSTLLQPTAGTAEIGGHNVMKDPDAVKRIIGYMPDFFGVYDDMKVWEYMDFFAAAYKIAKERRKDIIDNLLSLTDLTDKHDAYVETLSRGMKQRLCLAKTLIHDPQVLLLDEPASGLDPRARIEMRELLKELRKMGKTVLISSHILTELEELCNTIGIIEKGSLLVSGPIDEITSKLKGVRIVDIKLASEEEANKTHDILIAHEGVAEVGIDGVRLEVHLKEDAPADISLSRVLAPHDIFPQAVQERELDLEDIFMTITKGNVQ
ncbi:ABC transporter ATP-binding protein [Candidatus Sumerlaeota bacterium]|nr:ABC transporter ATP-binding protein [Candidatus Sumerlaeota bacterium]